MGETGVGEFSIWHWVIVIAVIWLNVAYWIAMVRILNRAGYSGWWSLITLVPVINIIALSRFSKAAWPAFNAPVNLP
jgi:uncharacterized membrane protein YhaH (DUF805 family)